MQQNDNVLPSYQRRHRSTDTIYIRPAGPRWVPTIMLAWGLTVLHGTAEPLTGQTATAPASAPASATTTAPAFPIDPAVERILDRLEKKGDQITDIEADISYVKIDPVLEDRQEYKGILRFKESQPNPLFFIRFDEFKQEGIVKKTKQWHVFDGQWYIEARESTKTIVKRQIVRQGEPLEVFKLGQGPFPLPFGQKKADIVKNFEVKLVPPSSKDPANCDHLECIPRPGTPLYDKYEAIHFYIDRALDLPTRVSTTEKQERNRIMASFSHIRINPGLAASALRLPDLSGYQIDTEPLPPPSLPKGEAAR